MRFQAGTRHLVQERICEIRKTIGVIFPEGLDY